MTQSRVEIVPVDDAFWEDQDALLAGLQESPPRIPPWFGYDELGSELFEEITELPSYYLTRVEHDLLRQHAGEIAERLGCGSVAELGSGSAKKTRLLLAACTDRRPTTYLPIDVSREMLVASAESLTAEFTHLRVRALWGRYEAGLASLRERDEAPVAVVFLGSNIGNTTPAERTALLREIAATLRPGDRFLVSADLDKPREVLEACYNDPAGRSAFVRFRQNHLAHLNHRFDSDFVLHRFYPRAHYDDATSTVEGHLYATEEHTVLLKSLGVTLHMGRGDSINVGYSAKFHRPRFVADVSSLGFALDAQWIDAVWQYGIFLFART
ncbi:L-histidine N(alpha)-methyltransferase [Pseudonocardia alaniniphila]|uniref:L-histidine N(Alpha)-methyltransferase n=1 Tax=Pseudonocardia alaniniphila TaxID=75291 RepID=A0ABS9TCA9_9PSEU|nr:L-histidine N(alpha)-methyltransferase [Pseudonocardia alaniniphila]MCH6166158.1 L-histidine N(alpha)-methyltransferase [Pseudonocardia alaniniphila]